MNFKPRTIDSLAEMICGNFPDDETFFIYRSSSQLTRFFRHCDTDYRHDGSTRDKWVAGVLEEILSESQSNVFAPPEIFSRIIDVLMDKEDAVNECKERTLALEILNTTLAREGYEAFYAEDDRCYLRHIETRTIINSQQNPNRPFSQHEILRREKLIKYFDSVSEDGLIETILLPLFRQLGFHRVTASGHKDKSLEYGKDLWMKYTLPTQHTLYFGIQVKKTKIDASGDSRSKNTNVAEIHNQALMMLGHEIFDHDTNRRVLVDHAYIISGSEITKQAKNWLGEKLDTSKRSQIIFMDREDLLNLFIVTNLPLPNEKLSANTLDELPF